MADLYPTPTRLALLREIFDGEVWQRSTGDSVIELHGGRERKVTAEVDAMKRAGWIILTPMKFGAKRWDLTDNGRAVLAAKTKG